MSLSSLSFEVPSQTKPTHALSMIVGWQLGGPHRESKALFLAKTYSYSDLLKAVHILRNKQKCNYRLFAFRIIFSGLESS